MGSLCHMYVLRSLSHTLSFKPQKPLFQGILLRGQFFYNFFVAPYLIDLQVGNSTNNISTKDQTTLLLDAYIRLHTELYCQRLPSLFTQSSLYSYYKIHVTNKSLIT